MLMSLPPAYADRQEPDREQRMEIIAEAISHATARASCSETYALPECKPIWSKSPYRLGALLVTKGWWESRFAKNVHEGKCLPYECDAKKIGKLVIHMARSPWQLQRTSYTKGLWHQLEGEDFESTRNAAWVAAKILAKGMDRCHTERGALSWYAVNRCDWSKAGNRFLTYKKIIAIKDQPTS